MRRTSLLLALALASCSGEPLPPPPAPTVTATTASTGAPSPPTLRLPKTAAPVRYAVSLTISPGKPKFEGAVDIDLTVATSSKILWLNATALAVSEAHLDAGGRSLAARVVPGGDDFVGLAFDEPLSVGPARLHVAYEGDVHDKDDQGIFSVDEDGASYVFSQFESTDARRAIPCFDEPSYKVPWQVTLRIPAGNKAFSNAPAASETREGALTAVRFADTRPLPSYLVAFAVGPFDAVEAGKAGKRGTPVRIVVPKGQGPRAAHAAATMPVLLAKVEDLFGVPFPYEKLDLVAVPRTVRFSAMENPGLITFRARYMLASPAEVTSEFRFDFAATMVHELGHHWFGDLVTTAWWDDIWLNEAFATWIEGRVLVPLEPAWHYELGDVRDVGRAMGSDALVSARAIRQPIATRDDIENAFDDITYTKGLGVISMFESFLGPDRFRAGLRRYLTERAHGTATAADLLAAVSAEAGRDVAPAFSTFLDQPGVPLVTAELQCSAKDGASVALSQERYLPVGSQGGPQAASWQIPVCVRWGRGKAEGRACTVLADRRATLPLPDAKGCPDWLLPNDRAAGYYHVAYTAKDLTGLFRGGKLELTDRAGLVRDLRALVAGGKLPIADALGRLPDLVKDAHPQILISAIGLAELVRDAMLSDADRPRFARFVNKTFGAKARALGWLPKRGDDDQTRALRQELVRFVADRGEDAALSKEADALARRWLDAPGSVDEDSVNAILATAAHRGDRALFDRLRAAAKETKDGKRRAHLLKAMSEFRDPAIVRAAREIALTDEHDPRDAVALVVGDPRAGDAVFAFVKDRFDAMVAKLPADWLSTRLPRVAEPFCDEAHRAGVEAFFKTRTDKIGGPRNLAKALERVHLCSALRDAQSASLAKFLAKH